MMPDDRHAMKRAFYCVSPDDETVGYDFVIKKVIEAVPHWVLALAEAAAEHDFLCAGSPYTTAVERDLHVARHVGRILADCNITPRAEL